MCGDRYAAVPEPELACLYMSIKGAKESICKASVCTLAQVAVKSDMKRRAYIEERMRAENHDIPPYMNIERG
jgi:hypothetical protein